MKSLGFILGGLVLLGSLSCAPPKRDVPRGAPMAQTFTLPAGYRCNMQATGQSPNVSKAVLINTQTGKVLAEVYKDRIPTSADVPMLTRNADVNLELRGYVLRPGSDAGGQPGAWEPMPVKLGRRQATSLRFVFEDGYQNDQPPEDWNDLIVTIQVVPEP